MKYTKRPSLSDLKYTRKIISYLLYFIIYFHSIKRVIYTTLFTIVIPLQLILLLIWAKKKRNETQTWTNVIQRGKLKN